LLLEEEGGPRSSEGKEIHWPKKETNRWKEDEKAGQKGRSRAENSGPEKGSRGMNPRSGGGTRLLSQKVAEKQHAVSSERVVTKRDCRHSIVKEKVTTYLR